MANAPLTFLPQTPPIRTPEQIAAAEARRKSFLDRQEKAAERAKERREQAALRIKMQREEQEDAMGHLGEVDDSRFQKSKNRKNRKDRTGKYTHSTSPKKPKSTFGDSPTRSMMINARDEDDEDDSIQSIQSNDERRWRKASPQTRQHPSTTSSTSSPPTSSSLYTFDRRFSRNQPIGMELEWSAKQGLVVKQVDSHGQASFLDVAKNDVVSTVFFLFCSSILSCFFFQFLFCSF